MHKYELGYLGANLLDNVNKKQNIKYLMSLDIGRYFPKVTISKPFEYK